ncbi:MULTISPECIES: bifunctional hydroxymethylpyrimidine kinase/phosphomethylpyrimidine kinase [unclassified Campylobacter]|uniref:bifunctional hydroxymethylpyrimidine kinase/phosphomethylpyrimidine kinase n=1 Tax=unclassified Campylobacter TaxID=2593542 RepID=UPI001BDAC65D|nr:MULTISPECIES: bifunctional hydroxymethylpyrimidine kinase/phosphomethylpyrimidine kinase [unclassified Campylobacter]MBZ7976272.1 bifunctional hydroxymethylpyrimidine kinase/phosphomethylpyrimidine kinase [Campylobacter sp. RM12637]MBZ7977719.1 bifunctional hydroxymethylpyrimidine kinase/phosphomethylpyrimidine kinase [Campylobacter sp. RM12654]MBZ7981581.1 bifunctional hydroxymethylpyrimidine kinase/phosphomethylpyrimidine kinase [Campylobacter sp. RM12640]MBZ7983696.1 bifunctional hydroxym
MLNPVLTIAGSDCSGGSGLEADLKTFTMHKTFGMAVVLGVYAVNTQGVYGACVMNEDIVSAQFDAVFKDIPPKALKTGLMGDANLIRLTIEKFKEYKPKNIVIDPVMFAKSGFRLIGDEDFKLYVNEFIKFADILTPNKLEAELLCGFEINSKEKLKDAAKKLIDLGAKSVIAKGGKYFDLAIDYFYDGKDFYELYGKPLNTTNDHGAGCTLSASIAANLANGLSKLQAVKDAKLYTQNAMEFAPNLGSGRGPLNHMFNL